MIGYLKGRVISSDGNKLIVDVNSVGYLVEVANVRFLENEEIQLFIHTHVREQELKLFGFVDNTDLKVFELLLSVSGVGPKAALLLVETYGASGVVQAIKMNNANGVKAKGIGMKTSEKIIIELKNKVGNISVNTDVDGEVKSAQKQGGTKIDEVIDALSSLGYRNNEVLAVIEKIDDLTNLDVSGIIRRSLELLKK